MSVFVAVLEDFSTKVLGLLKEPTGTVDLPAFRNLCRDSVMDMERLIPVERLAEFRRSVMESDVLWISLGMDEEDPHGWPQKPAEVTEERDQ